MTPKIRNIKTICSAPEGINLVTVKVETDEPGLYGVGCATFAHRHLAVVTAIEKYLKPFLIGKEVDRIEDIWQTVMGMSYWRNGPVLNNALSGVDMALWDIKGKMANMPLYQLLGGKCREAVPCYTHAEGKTTNDVIEQVYMLKDKGYTKIRAQVGGYGSNSVNIDNVASKREGSYYDPKIYMKNVLSLFDKLKAEFGDEIDFCHDVHERLSPADAMGFAKEMEQYKLLFLEDILPPEHVGWFKHIRSHSTVPLAMGELFNNPNEWIGIVSERLIDYIRIHISQIGGITPVKKLVALCETFGIRTAWHGPMDLTPIGHAVNAHIDLVSPNFGVQEWSYSNNGTFCETNPELMAEMFPGMPYVKKGYIYVNDKPGIGVDINEELATKYACNEQIVTWDWMLSKLPDGTSVRP